MARNFKNRARRTAARIGRGYKKYALPAIRSARSMAHVLAPQYSRQISGISKGVNALGRGFGYAKRLAYRR